MKLFNIGRKKSTSSQSSWCGVHTIINPDPESGEDTPYMTRIWAGRLRFHIFHRGDADKDCHDHPWDFWTFPFTSYAEEVLFVIRQAQPEGYPEYARKFSSTFDVVKRFRWHFREAEHCHRVIGKTSGKIKLRAVDNGFVQRPEIVPGRIVTLVWLSTPPRRKWGFWKNREGRWCWLGWRNYALEGGKHAPCE